MTVTVDLPTISYKALKINKNLVTSNDVNIIDLFSVSLTNRPIPYFGA